MNVEGQMKELILKKVIDFEKTNNKNLFKIPKITYMRAKIYQMKNRNPIIIRKKLKITTGYYVQLMAETNLFEDIEAIQIVDMKLETNKIRSRKDKRLLDYYMKMIKEKNTFALHLGDICRNLIKNNDEKEAIKHKLSSIYHDIEHRANTKQENLHLYDVI